MLKDAAVANICDEEDDMVDVLVVTYGEQWIGLMRLSLCVGDIISRVDDIKYLLLLVMLLLLLMLNAADR